MMLTWSDITMQHEDSLGWQKRMADITMQHKDGLGWQKRKCLMGPTQT